MKSFFFLCKNISYLYQMKICIINGPNLNLLGKRETAIYGKQSFLDYFKVLQKSYPNIELSYYQSNIEGKIIEKLQQIGFNYDGVILNAAAYTHTSIGIADAVKAIKAPVIEVHISNVTNRENFRHNSYIAPNCKGVILGFGLDGYRLAIESFNLSSVFQKGRD